MKRNLLFFLILISGFVALGQTNIDSINGIKKLPILGKHRYKFNYDAFALTNPALENPKLGWMSPMYSSEKIIFDFHPILTLHFFKNYNKSFKYNKKLGMGYYFTFRPHFRLYSLKSIPVQMPSYRFFLGLQHLYKINKRNIISYKLESGHYSNGQSGCTFGEGIDDKSRACDSIYSLINDESNLSSMLNRNNGDFSTNLTNVLLVYRLITKFEEYKTPQQIHTFSFGITVYHNNFLGIIDKGGIADENLAIYGRSRFLLGYNYLYKWASGYRFLVEENFEIISGAHPWVNPLRSMTTFTMFLPRNIGFFVNYIYGHDNYNIRFVDSGHQFGAGITWDLFAPLPINQM